MASGIIEDLAPVKAALTTAWSDGQTEEQVQRLTLIKRQMEGHAKFDRLRRRWLHSALTLEERHHGPVVTCFHYARPRGLFSTVDFIGRNSQRHVLASDVMDDTEGDVDVAM
ncbi:hypothetical protein NITHO_2910001 [Nitrolancea hollandica Lb]|uniref:Uncharacterized protein n=1 Tax=Nitrolancea hollandica Lb TaxID=1129897 RepID=I4EGZ5_9BACT|nr:hypothetical protein NITHO_2910001 [Nitrolancea hollandica Lb]